MAEDTTVAPPASDPVTGKSISEEHEHPSPEHRSPAKKINQSVSFKEETNIVGDLPDSEKKSLEELKQLIEDALNKHELSSKPKEEEKPKSEVAGAEGAALPSAGDDDGAKTVEAIKESVVPVLPPEEVSIWGIPLLKDDLSDVILLKFLRARDFKVKDSFSMIKNTIRWREEFGIEKLLEEDLGTDLEKVVFIHGVDKEGHPVCYNVYGEFQNKELYNSTFSDEKSSKFLRWRIQFLEKSIRKLDFNPSGVSTFVQVTDFKNSPGPTKKELRIATNQALHLLQDNYPEFAAKQIFINVPWWYLAYVAVIAPFTLRTRSKFVFAGLSKSTNVLFKYISPEQVPVRYGGLNRGEETVFSPSDAVTEVSIKPASKHVVDFPVSDGLVVWELRVLGWDVKYGSEFVPNSDEGYTVIVQKSRKVSPTDEAIISGSFKVGEPGKVVLTIDNQSSKKKKLLYRFKVKSSG